jgi:Nuclease-related domain
MAFYLRLAFADAADFFANNDFRVSRGEENAQIDHLVVNRLGLVLIENKSVSDQIKVNRKGEFARNYQGKLKGMKSPMAKSTCRRIVASTRRFQTFEGRASAFSKILLIKPE